MKSMKLSDYFLVVKPQYVFLRLIPDTSIRNYNSSNIAKAISHMYKNIFQSISRHERKFVFETQVKCSYFIDIRKMSVDFYFIVPVQYVSIAKEKIRETWPKITIDEVGEGSIAIFSPDCIKYSLGYKKEDALSLNVDRKSNEPLNCLLNVIDIIQDDDRIGIYYNFMPCSQLPWPKYYKATMDKVKNRIPIEREKMSGAYIAKMGITYLMNLLDGIIEAIGDVFGIEKKSDSQIDFIEAAAAILNNNTQLSASTTRKKNETVIDTQIMVLSQSKDRTRQNNNALAVCQSYKSIEEDNEIVFKQIKTHWNITDFKSAKAEVNKMSIGECSNLIQLPGRDLLQQHTMIDKVDVLEVALPGELSHGYITLGETTYKGKKQNAYLRDEYHQGNLPLTVMGPQGSGKTTFFANYALNAHSRHESVIVIDFIKNCELAGAVESVIPQNDLCVLDLSKAENLQGLGYNEIKFEDGMSDFERLDLANLQAQQVMSLVDSINSEGLPLTSKMRRYLSSAANIVFLQELSNIRDVMNCLQDFRKRATFIDAIPEQLRDQLEDEINALRELDEITVTKDKDAKETYQAIAGTKDSKIDGILDRINLLKEDMKLKYMFNKRLDGNIDIVDEVEHGKVILIKIPELKFPLPYVKNVIVTYFVTKLWLMLQIRGAWYEKPKRCHIILDEIYQAPTCERILRGILPQSRKFGGKFVISCHYLSQIDTISEALKASGSSFMLLQGTDKKNYDELKEELQPYDLEDLLNLKQFCSLNLIKYEKGYAKFITHLPLPI